MSDQESTKREGDYPKAQSAHKDVASDIEKALSFIDSEEYGAASPPVAGNKPKSPETVKVEPIPEERLEIAEEGDKNVPLSRQMEKDPLQKPLFPPEDAQEESGSKFWIIFVVAAILIGLTIFFLL